MTMPNVLRLTDAGQQAINNASAGGIQIKPRTYEVGDYAGNAPVQVPDKPLGDIIDSGRVLYIQVLNSKSVRFTVEMALESKGTVGELMLYLDDNTPLCHATINPKQTKTVGKALQIELVMNIVQGSTEAISVELSSLGSIPSVATVETLPSPIDSIANAISVLDLMGNPDGTRSPAIAMAYGAGSQHWGFAGYDRNFNGTLGAQNIISDKEFKLPSNVNIEMGDVVVQAITGTSAGKSRKGVYDGSKVIMSTALQLDGQESVSIWTPCDGNGNGVIIPPTDGVPSDYVLTAGDKDGTRWAKQYGGAGGNVGTALYYTPSKLRINSKMFDGDGNRTYDLGVDVDSSANIMTSIGGITQHRTAIGVNRNTITFAEPLDEELDVMLRAFTHEASSGDRCTIKSAAYVTDGSRRTYPLPLEVARANDVIIYIDRIDQNLASYTVDLEEQTISFTSAPKAGYAIEINAFAFTKETGYSTSIEVFTFRTSETTNYFELPYEPEDKDFVFMYAQGMHVHKEHISVADTRVVTTEDLPADLEIEIMVFRNHVAIGSPQSNLVGVVTGLQPHRDGLEIIRHGSRSVPVTLPQVKIDGDSNIEVLGEFPEFKLQMKSAAAGSSGMGAIKVETQSRSEEGVAELSLPIKINLLGKDAIIKATATFQGQLGPGFVSTNKTEHMQAVLAVVPAGSDAPNFGSKMRGCVSSGFASLGTDIGDDAIGFSNSNATTHMQVLASAHPQGYVTIVGKVKFADTNVEAFDTWLNVEVSYEVITV